MGIELFRPDFQEESSVAGHGGFFMVFHSWMLPASEGKPICPDEKTISCMEMGRLGTKYSVELRELQLSHT